ncbi:MAG: monothiol glutaredoxin, Grx4 family [Pelagibacteraceae bacterium]|jgi:monothiol glutaredoxin|nr:monothiol glutaredoxin, Grx4 family [Pelagibacteraceae bacterium]|tara:strand:+ start:1029 stop:1370 length:342 start_codon:yes stop_codon:yes gene_type:complete
MSLEIGLKTKIEDLINSKDVFLFMKGNPDFPMCGFSSTASAILKKCGVEFGHCNVLDNEDVREGIKLYSNWPTIPQLYIKKEFIGGCDIMKEMAESGELLELLTTRGIATKIT